MTHITGSDYLLHFLLDFGNLELAELWFRSRFEPFNNQPVFSLSCLGDKSPVLSRLHFMKLHSPASDHLALRSLTGDNLRLHDDDFLHTTLYQPIRAYF